MTAPDRIYINKVHGQHPEDWDFTDGKYLTKKQLAAKVEYIRADLAALAPTDAAQDDDPECTDCGGTGITYQTERRCACQGPDLSDPVTVHANMLRGTIAKPTLEQIIHLYGVDALTKALAPIEYERKVAQMKKDFPNGI